MTGRGTVREAINPDELSARIAAALGRRYRLTPLGVKCTYPVFKGEVDGASPIFVKVGPKEEWTRTVNLLREIGDCGFFSRFLTDAPIEYRGSAVFIMEWRDSRIVFPEDMSDRQAESFVAGCVRLGEVLELVRVSAGHGDRDGTENTPEELFENISQYARRHRIAGRLLKGLVDIPVAERTFGSRPLSVIHGDFHSKNFGFSGDEFASVFDFDKLTRGLACMDLANALVERFSCLGLSVATRRRLAERTRYIVSKSPWPREDFVIACNIVRLQFAARRVAKHPNSAWVALDILRRDRRIREFLTCLR